ncbi:hypothetical protein P170DRAFT_434928 [Aspergillus steynii IBT 23096]|uniref:Uncharacterized protein n=1 Tax=Aspergillus steynii IBT 23096 TaxID=1392250 RepID=A0A2I2GK17_9EURO|nr:uncharacterized protein P170DRAFT_434928 [Aspergillus steynii IBT 23096]PLB53224.1 hypothetical protein P170DRAFT_434928 [Aspergillus steynii IBT 23096]
MHPLKNILRLSFLPRTRTRPWKGKSVEIDYCSVHCHNEYHIPSGTAAFPLPPLPPASDGRVTVTVNNVGDDSGSPSLFSASACDSDSDSDCDSEVAVNESALDLDLNRDLHPLGVGASSRAGLVRVVSWASILSHRCRWTRRQERDLAIAEREQA